MNDQKISDLRDILDGVGSKFFYVHFIKRSNGEIRKMLCLAAHATQKGKTGQGQSYDPKKKGLYYVVDVNEIKTVKKTSPDLNDDEVMKECFRSIPLENVTKITSMGKTLYES